MKYVLNKDLYDTYANALGTARGKKVIPASNKEVTEYLNEVMGILGGISELVIEQVKT